MVKKIVALSLMVALCAIMAGCGDDDDNNPPPQAFNNFPVQNRDTLGDDFFRNNWDTRFRSRDGQSLRGSDFYYAVEYQNKSRYSEYGYVPFNYIDPYFYTGYDIYDPYYAGGWINFGGFYNNLMNDANTRYFGNGININFMFEFNQDSKNNSGNISIGL